MEFGNPQFAWNLLWVLPLLVFLVAYGRRARVRRLTALIPDEGQRRGLTASVGTKRRRLRLALFIAALLLLCLAILRPQLGHETVRQTVRGRDVLVLLDVSRSMLARDLSPSRLKIAKMLIVELAESLPGDRMGLVAFSGKAAVLCPLTINRDSLHLLLEDVDTSTIPSPGTNLQAALELASESFRGAEGEHQAIILITDGEELQGDHSKALSALKAGTIPVHVLGIGDPSEGAFIQLHDATFVMEDGKRVRTRLNEAALQEIASGTGGVYARASDSPATVVPIAERVRIMNPGDGKETTATRPIERYHWPLFLAIVCLACRFLVGERRTLSQVAAACLFLVSINASAGKVDPQVEKLKQDLKQSGSPTEQSRIRYNLALRYQSLGDNGAAEKLYDQVAGSIHTPLSLRAAAYQNLGAMSHKGVISIKDNPDQAIAKLAEAILHYAEALRLRNDRGLRRNLELAQHELKAANRRAAYLAEQERLKEDVIAQTKAALKAQTRANELSEKDSDAQREAIARTQAALNPAKRLEKRKIAKELGVALDREREALIAMTDYDLKQAGLRAEEQLRKILKSLDALTKPQKKPKQNPSDSEQAKKKKSLAMLKAMELDEKKLREEMKKQQGPSRAAPGVRNW